MRHGHFLQMGGFKLRHIMGDQISTWNAYRRDEATEEGGVVQECVISWSEVQ